MIFSNHQKQKRPTMKCIVGLVSVMIRYKCPSPNYRGSRYTWWRFRKHQAPSNTSSW